MKVALVTLLAKNATFNEPFSVLIQEIKCNCMFLLDGDPLGLILKEIPSENFACRQYQDTGIFTKEACVDCVGLHVILILYNLANLHFLCIP